MDKEQSNINLESFLKKEKPFLEDLERVDMQKNWQRLEKATKKKGGRHIILAWSIAAASILILIVTGSILLRDRSGSMINQVAAQKNGTEVVLKDGTIVSLNQGAEIRYIEQMINSKREVKLTGEAYFEVESRKNSPFFVYMDYLTVKVTGTTFNIATKEESTEVSVFNGEVHFYKNNEEKEAVTLHAGQNAVFTVTEQKIVTGEFISENFLFWKTGMLEFNNDSLATVCRELEKWFGTTIILSSEVDPGQRWTSIHEDETLKDILNEITFYFDLEYSEIRDTIYIKPMSQSN